MNIFTIIIMVVVLLVLSVSIALIFVLKDEREEKKKKLNKEFKACGYVGTMISSISLCGLVNKGQKQTRAKEIEERNKMEAFYNSNIYRHVRG